MSGFCSPNVLVCLSSKLVCKLECAFGWISRRSVVPSWMVRLVVCFLGYNATYQVFAGISSQHGCEVMLSGATVLVYVGMLLPEYMSIVCLQPNMQFKSFGVVLISSHLIEKMAVFTSGFVCAI